MGSYWANHPVKHLAVVSEEQTAFGFLLWFFALVIMATVCWGLKNNCTERTIIKEHLSNCHAKRPMLRSWRWLVISLIKKESLSRIWLIAIALALGFVAYGLNVFHVCREPRMFSEQLKLVPMYAVQSVDRSSPAFCIFGESLSWMYVILDRDGHWFCFSGDRYVLFANMTMNTSIHSRIAMAEVPTHTVRHSRDHKHYLTEEKHRHRHSIEGTRESRKRKKIGKNQI